MDERQRKEIQGVFENNVHWDCLMDRYTTFRVGGPAEALCTCMDLPQLEWLVSFLRSEAIPFFVLGNGSNVLVKDSGYRGVILRLGGRLASLEAGEEGSSLLAAGGGAAIQEMLRTCAERGLGGLEFLAGIPGTAGGAVAMNAGAWGKEVAEFVLQIQMADPKGGVVSRDRSGLKFFYRGIALPEGGVIVKVLLQLERAEPEEVARRIHDYLLRRKAVQPLEFPSGGSVFKNPPNQYAGKLIEEAGLKGKRVGGAMISPKHANFIVNAGGASAEDVLALMALAKETVLERSGVELEPEIRLIG